MCEHDCDYDSGLVRAKVKGTKFIGPINWSLEINTSSSSCSIPINFCPFCGKRMLQI